MRKWRFVTYLDTLALGEGDPGLVLADDEDLGLAGSEGVVNGVLDVDDVETTIVTLTVSDNTNTTHVTTTSGHGDNTGVELDEVGDLASGNVNLDSVVDLDGRVGVTDGSSVVGHNVGNTTSANSDLADLEELVGGLLRGDAVDGESALDVVEQTEVLARLFDGDNIF